MSDFVWIVDFLDALPSDPEVEPGTEDEDDEFDFEDSVV